MTELTFLGWLSL